MRWLPGRSRRRRGRDPSGRAWSAGRRGWRVGGDREPLDRRDLDAVAPHGLDLGRVVGQQPHRQQPERAEDRRAGGILPAVHGQVELELRVDGVEPGVLQGVGLQLRDEPDTAALVSTQVDEHAALGRDPLQGTLELGPAVAPQRPEGVTGEALGVQSHQRVRSRGTTRADQRHVLVTGEPVAEPDGRELAVPGGQRRLGEGLDPVVQLPPGDRAARW